MDSELNRRQLIAAGAVAAANLKNLAGAFAADAAPGRRLGTCGPPPRKNPERRTGAEGMPPLPLPATPLRRSEPKAEPTPPLVAAKLEYGTTQDWNTDPGDMDNLLRHLRSALGLWYGWRTLNVNELVAQYQAGQRCKLPILYISGHEAFELTDPQRDAIRQYVLDGGTLVGDACCGRAEFAQSFRREVAMLFPKHSFELLQIDHPIYRAFYHYTTVHYRTFSGGVKNEYEGPPQIFGVNIGARTGVLFSPFDLSCGWDEHVHETGGRLIPGDAIRLGLNLVSYVAAMRQLAETQAVTNQVKAPSDRPRQQFVLAQLRHHGDWNPDPNSTYQWLRHLAGESSLAISFDLKYVDPQEGQIAPYPFLYLTGLRDPRLKDEEIRALLHHLQAGGFLFVNNCSGYHEFDQHVRRLIKRMFPDQDLAAVKSDHPLLSSFYKIKQLRDRQTGQPRQVDLEGISIKNRLVLAYSKNDTVTQLKQVSDPFGNGYDADSCRQLLVNTVVYAMQN